MSVSEEIEWFTSALEHGEAFARDHGVSWPELGLRGWELLEIEKAAMAA